MIEVLVSLLAASVLVGCAYNCTVRSQADFDVFVRGTTNLQSEAIFDGYVNIHGLLFIGSDASYDYFVYPQTRGGVITHKQVRVLKGLDNFCHGDCPYRMPIGMPVYIQTIKGRFDRIQIDTNNLGFY
jgi:hypothetical protein